MRRFDPTDTIIIPARKPVIKGLIDSGFRMLLDQEDSLREFLEANHLKESDLEKFFEPKRELVIQHPFSYDKSHPLSHHLVTHRTRSLSFLLFVAKDLGIKEILHSLPSNPRILEIGSGNGRLLLELRNLLPKAYLTGVCGKFGEEGYEGLKTTAELAKVFGLPQPDERMNILFKDLNEESLPGADESFDVILSLFCIRYLKNKKKFLKAIYKKLRPGGVAIFDLQMTKVLNDSGEEVPWNKIFGRDDVNGFMLLKKTSQELLLNIMPDYSQFRFSPWDERHPDPVNVGWLSVYRWSGW